MKDGVMARSKAWRKEHQAMDAVALALAVADRLDLIILHAWNETGFNQIWDEATDAQDDIGPLIDYLKEHRAELAEKAREG